MKCLVLAAWVVLLAFASSADAGRKLSIYSDAALTQSSIDDNAPGIVSLYVVDTGFLGATGVRFSTEPSAGFTGVWLGDASSFVTVGSSPTDISVGYAACRPAPVLVLTMSYQLFGISAPCSELRVAPPDGFTCVYASDFNCSFIEGCIPELGHLRVNCPVASDPTTWGRVKALYRDR